MSSRSARRRKRKQAEKRRQVVLETPEPVKPADLPPEPEVAPDEPLEAPEAPEDIDEEPEQEPEFPDIDQIIDEMDEGNVLTVIECGEDEVRVVYGSGMITEAAETAAAQYITSKTQQGVWPTDTVMVTVFTKEAEFGPFPMDVDLLIDAKFLREATTNRY
jgi:hypothetical protein